MTLRTLEVRRDEDGYLDEVVATGADIHIECMDDNCWWMSIRTGDREVHVTFTTARAVINARCDGVWKDPSASGNAR
jgi:hypothetical protein